MVKIAFLHFDCLTGPISRNLRNLAAGIRQAAVQGAEWVLAPELAVQGYHFTVSGKPYTIREDIEAELEPLLCAVRESGIYLFLGTAVRDRVSHLPHNSCLVISPEGKIIGRHDKGLVHAPAEAWATPGKENHCVVCDGHRVGILVCADAWYDKNGAALGGLGAESIVVVAAWPPGCGGPPEKAWERCSMASGGRPVLVCNQTGRDERMNCCIANSAVIVDGHIQMSYQGEPAILLAEMDLQTGAHPAENFTVLPFWEARP